MASEKEALAAAGRLLDVLEARNNDVWSLAEMVGDQVVAAMRYLEGCLAEIEEAEYEAAVAVETRLADIEQDVMMLNPGGTVAARIRAEEG